MRTTVTLEPEVKALLAEAAYRTGKPFKVVLNEAVRTALAPKAARLQQRRPPQWPVHDLGRPMVDLTKATALADELTDRGLVKKLGRGK